MHEQSVTESVTTHTPGPWRQNNLLVTDGHGNQIAHCTRWENGQPMPYVAAANARLIANVPDLLRVLRNVESYFDDSRMTADVFDALVADVRRVVAQAEGRAK